MYQKQRIQMLLVLHRSVSLLPLQLVQPQGWRMQLCRLGCKNMWLAFFALS